MTCYHWVEKSFPMKPTRKLSGLLICTMTGEHFIMVRSICNHLLKIFRNIFQCHILRVSFSICCLATNHVIGRIESCGLKICSKIRERLGFLKDSGVFSIIINVLTITFYGHLSWTMNEVSSLHLINDKNVFYFFN